MVMDKVLENTFYKDCSLPYFLDKNTRSEILPVAVHVSFILNWLSQYTLNILLT